MLTGRRIHSLKIISLAFTCTLLAGTSGVMTGCRPDSSKQLTQNRVDAGIWLKSMPTYETIRQAQNQRVGRISKFSSAGNAELDWHDDQGDHVEEGETNLIFVRPSNVALTFRKLGNVYLWWGSDADEFWMFQGGDEKKAYVARAENAFLPCCDPLPVPFHPVELVDLLGVIDLPEEAVLRREVASAMLLHQPDAPAPADVALVSGDVDQQRWIVEIPGRWSWRRIAFDPKTLRPEKVELIDGYHGRVLVAADLSRYVQMEVRGIAPGLDPPVPTAIEIRDGAHKGSGVLKLSLIRPADRRANDAEIAAALFEFDKVAGSMRPKTIEVLDRRCAHPAAVDDTTP